MGLQHRADLQTHRFHGLITDRNHKPFSPMLTYSFTPTLCCLNAICQMIGSDCLNTICQMIGSDCLNTICQMTGSDWIPFARWLDLTVWIPFVRCLDLMNTICQMIGSGPELPVLVSVSHHLWCHFCSLLWEGSTFAEWMTGKFCSRLLKRTIAACVIRNLCQMNWSDETI